MPVTPPGIQVITRYINSTKGMSSWKDNPQVASTPSISGILSNTGVYRHTTDPILFETGHSPGILKLAQQITYTYTHLHVSLRVNCNLKQNEA